MKIKLWLRYDDGREYMEYRKKSAVVPEDVMLSCLRESARRAGNRVVASSWQYVEEVQE